METAVNVLNAEKRPDKGKGPSRRLRNGGHVPAVLYSAGKEPVTLGLEPKALNKAINGPLGFNTLLTINITPGTETRTVLVKDVQRHPVRQELVHADFLEVDPKKPVRVRIPLVLSGKNKNLGAGGVVEQVSRKVTVKALPTAIPEKIDVDISELKMGQSIHLRDVKLPAGLAIIGSGMETVVTVVAVREEKAAVAAVATDAAAAAVPGKPGEAAKPGDAKAAAPAADKAGAAKAAPAKEEAKKK